VRSLSKKPAVGIGGEAGFTLFEILVALFILLIIFSSLFASYTGTLKVTREWEDTGRAFGMARGTMERMLKDIEAAYPYEEACPFVMEPEIIKEKSFPRLSFYSCNRTNPDGAETPSAGISRITYTVRLNPETGGYELNRTESSDAGATSSGSDYVICRGLSSLSYRFYDGDGKDISETLCSTASKGRPASVVLDLELVNPRESTRPFHFMTRVHPVNITQQES